MAPESVQLLVGTQLDPQLNFVAIVVGHDPAHRHLFRSHPHRRADFAFDDVAYLRQPLVGPQVVDEDHRRLMVASLFVAEAISPILDALYHGLVDDAERLVAEAGPHTLTIHEAAAMGVSARIAQLLDADPAAVNAWASDGFQPLGLAAFFGRREAVELLLARGGEVNTPARNAFKVAALHAALAGPQPSIATLLVAAGADVNARQQGGVTPLHEAAHIGDATLIQLLLEHGADPSATEDQGKTPADTAREHGHAEVVALLNNASS